MNCSVVSKLTGCIGKARLDQDPMSTLRDIAWCWQCRGECVPGRCLAYLCLWIPACLTPPIAAAASQQLDVQSDCDRDIQGHTGIYRHLGMICL